jgi:putative tricarboxylic transport membrane protein
MWVGRFRRPKIVAAASVLGSLTFVFVFMKVVYVSLPLGVGPFRTLSAWIMAALGIH